MHPMQAFAAGALAAMFDKMRDIAVIREVRHCTPEGFDVVFGSGVIIRVKLETIAMGSEKEADT